MKYIGRKSKNWVKIHRDGSLTYYSSTFKETVKYVYFIYSDEIYALPIKERQRIFKHISKNKWDKKDSIWSKPCTT